MRVGGESVADKAEARGRDAGCHWCREESRERIRGRQREDSFEARDESLNSCVSERILDYACTLDFEGGVVVEG